MMTITRFSIILLLFVAFFFACGESNSDPFADCQYKKPVAAFSESLSEVNSHTFKMEGTTGVEQVLFKNGVSLELYQSGCNEIRQEFRFIIPGTFEIDEPQFWIDQAAQQFDYLGELSDAHAGMLMWAGEIRKNTARLELGQALEIQPTYFIKIDRIRSMDKVLIIVELFQRMNSSQSN